MSVASKTGVIGLHERAGEAGPQSHRLVEAVDLLVAESLVDFPAGWFARRALRASLVGLMRVHLDDMNDDPLLLLQIVSDEITFALWKIAHIAGDGIHK